MKIFEDINKQFFIYDNVIDETLFTEIFSNINNELAIGNQSVRFSVINHNTNTEFKIYQKQYNKFNELELKMFHTNFDNLSNFELLRRDCDINLNYSLYTKITENVNQIIKNIYNLEHVEIEYASVIQYGPGYLMRIHQDSTPHNPRLCTAVLYCNDMTTGDVGGDVIFYDNTINQNIVHTYSPKRNQLVIFDSYFNEWGIPHSVTKIENWNRYVYRIYYKLPK